MLRIVPAILAAFILSSPALAQEGDDGGSSDIDIEAPGPSPAGEIQERPQIPAATAPTEAKDPFDLGVHGTPFNVNGQQDPDPQATERRKQEAEAAVQTYLEEQRRQQAPASAPAAGN